MSCLRMLRDVLLVGVCFLCGIPSHGAPDHLEIGADLREELYLPKGAPLNLTTLYVCKAPRSSAAELQASAPRIMRLEAAHVGQQRLLFKVAFDRRPNFESESLLLYVDLDSNVQTGRQDSREHRGVDLMIVVSRSHVGVSLVGPLVSNANTAVAAVKQVDQTLYISFDGPLAIAAGKVRLRAYAVSERPSGGRSDGTPHDVVELPEMSGVKPPALPSRGTPDLRPLSDYRYHNPLVKLEKRSDKGLTYEAIRPAQPVEFGRPRPAAPFSAAGRRAGQGGTLVREQVPVELLEEQGVARRDAVVSFGLPLPQGGLFDLGQLRVLAPNGREVPAQFTATGFWPDDSLKWVLVDFAAPMAAGAAAKYTVELGSQVRRVEAASPLKVEQNDETLTVVTGPLKVQLHKKRFHLFDGVWLAGRPIAASAPAGARLVDEQGTLFTMSGRAPQSVRIEEQGPRKLTVRVEGVYASAQGQSYMRYIARLVFRAGSPRVELIYTHLNDYLRTEFTDVASLELPLLATGDAEPAVFLSGKDEALTRHAGHKLRLFQLDENRSQLQTDGQEISGGRAPGVLHCGGFSAAVHDFWQRWPKGLSTDGPQVNVELLPRQPGAQFGQGLPHQLLFPFVDGFYRFKWGMSFTERVSFDFSGQLSAAEVLAEAQRPLAPVLPAAWYARTKALGPLAMPQGRQFALWDQHVAQSYDNFLRERAGDRAYGYFNYGDWYGERGRNWGNNEYDFAHGFFLQFARTGNRDYFRVALAAARHQADVDCVHAYPDPYYVGSNHQHSIGHTGMWTERPRYGTWTWRYDMHTAADNGHTWSEGMVEAWLLAGEAPVMEAALGLGEHIAWGMSRTFKSLGTHERSAGWSLKAIMELYRATYDPLYLDASRRIATVALAEQKFDDGGAWPHILPGDHSGGRAGARGNAIYLMGVLLQGLAEYHRETADPRVPKALESGSRWLLKCWNEEVQGWPYTALVSGEPLFPPGLGSNLMAAGPLAYTGQVTGDRKFIDIAEAGLAAVVRSGGSGNGKAIAQQMNFTSGLLAILQQWHATHDADQGKDLLSGVGEDFAQYLAKTRDAREHSVRGPNKKTFLVQLRETSDAGPVATTLIANRRPFGAMGKRAAEGTLSVRDASGSVVKQGQFSTDGSHEFRCPLRGQPGSVFTVLIDDDQRGVWSLTGEGLEILMRTGPGFSIGGIGRGRYHFFVPQGTPEFTVQLRPGHNGLFAGVVLTPREQTAGVFQGLHQPAAAKEIGSRRTETPGAIPIASRGQITVRPAAADTGQVWSLILTAGGDLEVELQGLPPYLSLRGSAWPAAARTK